MNKPAALLAATLATSVPSTANGLLMDCGNHICIISTSGDDKKNTDQSEEECNLEAFRFSVEIKQAIDDSEIHFHSWDEIPDAAYSKIKQACMAAKHCATETNAVLATQEAFNLASIPELEQATIDAANATHTKCMSEISKK